MGKLKTTAEDFQAAFTEVLNIVAQGETVHYGMKCLNVDKSFLSWVFADDKRKELYEQAQTVAAEVISNKLLALAEENPSPEEMYMLQAKAKIYTHLAEKWYSQRYGQKKQVEVTQTVDIAGALEAAEQRVIEGRARLISDD